MAQSATRRACSFRRSVRWPTSSCRKLAVFYAVSGAVWLLCAGTMPLYSVLVRENFPLRMVGSMGTEIGGTAMAGSVGMATGPMAGGLIYDTFANYAWLHIGSWAVGLGAFAIALTIRPFAKIKARSTPVTAQKVRARFNFRGRVRCALSKRQLL
jgi:MFS family permease